MADPGSLERDLAAKVRQGLERLRAYAPGPELSNPNVWTATQAKAALDSLLALTVKYREALTEIAEGYPHSHDEGHGDAANCAVCFAADTINDADPAHDEGSLE